MRRKYCVWVKRHADSELWQAYDVVYSLTAAQSVSDHLLSGPGWAMTRIRSFTEEYRPTQPPEEEPRHVGT